VNFSIYKARFLYTFDCETAMNRKAVAILLILVVIGVFAVMACSKDPAKDSGQEAQAQTVSGGIPQPAAPAPATTGTPAK
jgi:hypothetical protein